jgi:DMSO reductase anchor subunit
LALVGVLAPVGLVPQSRWFAVAALGLALALATAGLLSSTFHLGHPERAWRAITQWRSSWLSREGLAALAAYPPAGAFALGWLVAGDTAGFVAWTGAASAVLAVAVVACTGMIYASLKPIRQWHNGYVTPLYLLFAAMTGALWLNALTALWGASMAMMDGFATAAIILTAVVKEGYWWTIDAGRAASSPETATGLLGRGKVRLLEAPHTEENFLQQEMGFTIARRHARKLRAIARMLAFAVPLVLTVIAWAAGGALGALAALAALVAALIAMVGVLIERWLFFAEAKHTAMLYYGAAEA